MHLYVPNYRNPEQARYRFNREGSEFIQALPGPADVAVGDGVTPIRSLVAEATKAQPLEDISFYLQHGKVLPRLLDSLALILNHKTLLRYTLLIKSVVL
jgi:hypothetical protein